ncbi:hypothetical protein BT96DRAFT_917285 [Gymnopus androsaceus JB14]|uniref:Uncharacterized protein n=1 Tax=Gymnopus androsaceus JB14 TaxID=1447944 RepID=A0A6A4I0R5_9AGAR|nr:hypothetical protein BT96DRAFT_917285 [Gymnopus androsaceus JB14]
MPIIVGLILAVVACLFFGAWYHFMRSRVRRKTPRRATPVSRARTSRIRMPVSQFSRPPPTRTPVSQLSRPSPIRNTALRPSQSLHDIEYQEIVTEPPPAYVPAPAYKL